MNETIKIFLDNWETSAKSFYEEARQDYLNKKGSLSYIDLQNYMCNHYGKSNYVIIKDSYKNINEIIKKESNKKYTTLIKAIEKKAGNIKDIINLNIDGKSGNLNGFIVGENGTFSVATIYAGGHNIQCLHFRTLVKKIK